MTGLTWDNDPSGDIDPQTLTDVEVLSIGLVNVDGVPSMSTRVRGRLEDGRTVEVDFPGGPVHFAPGPRRVEVTLDPLCGCDHPRSAHEDAALEPCTHEGCDCPRFIFAQAAVDRDAR